MTMIDFAPLRRGLGRLDASASHSASGESRPRTDEIFAPEQHAGALDPNTTIVLGSRGAGKSFWAGVLGDENTKLAAASAYPQQKSASIGAVSKVAHLKKELLGQYGGLRTSML